MLLGTFGFLWMGSECHSHNDCHGRQTNLKVAVMEHFSQSQNVGRLYDKHLSAMEGAVIECMLPADTKVMFPGVL